MQMEVGEVGEIRLKKVYNPIVFETEEGEQLIVCMRDGAFEIQVLDTENEGRHGLGRYRLYSVNGKGITEL